MRHLIPLLVIAGSLLTVPSKLYAQQAEKAADQEMQALYQKFEETLNGTVLTGQFTVLGQEGPPREEKYEIESVKKAEDDSDFWLFNARVKYGDKDVLLPMPLKVRWAGDTPIITLTNTTIPGLGTFSSRVVIYNNKYAGTWTHGKVGGHLFGTIQKKDAEKDASAEKGDKEPSGKDRAE